MPAGSGKYKKQLDGCGERLQRALDRAETTGSPNTYKTNAGYVV